MIDVKNIHAYSDIVKEKLGIDSVHFELAGGGFRNIVYSIRGTDYVIRQAHTLKEDSLITACTLLDDVIDKYSLPKIIVLSPSVAIVERLATIPPNVIYGRGYHSGAMPCNWEVLNSITRDCGFMGLSVEKQREALYGYFDTVRYKEFFVDSLIEKSIEAILAVNERLDADHNIMLDFNLSNVMIRPSTGEYILSDIFGSIITKREDMSPEYIAKKQDDLVKDILSMWGTENEE